MKGNHEPCRVCGGAGRGVVIFKRHEFEGEGGHRFPKRDVHGPCGACGGFGRVLKPIAALAVAAALAFPAYAQDRLAWGDTGVQMELFIAREPDQLVLTWKNRLAVTADAIPVFIDWHGVQVRALFLVQPDAAPDTLYVYAPDGYVAEPAELTLGEGEIGVVIVRMVPMS